MEEIYFALFNVLSEQVQFVDHQYFSSGYSHGLQFLSYIVDEFLPISYRSDGIVLKPANGSHFYSLPLSALQTLSMTYSPSNLNRQYRFAVLVTWHVGELYTYRV